MDSALDPTLGRTGCHDPLLLVDGIAVAAIFIVAPWMLRSRAGSS